MIAIEQLRARWQGVVIPLVTPFKEDLSLDLDALAGNVQWLLDQGARTGNSVFLAAGSGGDFTSMTTQERKQVIATVCQAAAGRVPVMASAQSTDIRVCIELCQFGEQIGLDAVQLSGPYYYDGRPGDVLAWMRQVADETRMGFALYNNWYTGYDMPLTLIEELLAIPNSIAIKWGSPNPFVYTEGIRRFSRRAVVVDNSLLPALAYPLGVRCHISHLPNFYPQNSWRFHELWCAGREADAMAEWERCMPAWLALIAPIQAATGGEGVFVRPAMDAAGLRGGYSRLPSRDDVVTPALREGYRQLLAGYRAGE